MGFFNKPGTSASGLAPLSSARIKAALEAEGWRYSVDEDGDIRGGWDDGVFFFLLRGKRDQVFYIRGTWYVSLASADLDKAREACDEWNRTTIWPKAYTVTFDDGEVVRVCAEHTVDYEHGLTDEQLVQQIRCTVSSGCDFFEKLNEIFPEQAAAQSDE